MDLVKPSWTDDKLERDEKKHGKDVERGLVGKDGISFDSLKSEDCPTELNLGRGVCGDVAKGVGQHRDENG